ncbi:hypothetical protein FGRMN_6240 [Fusarium graminum]|nr:hypothetical protein FGRMN_6240 [Fusarium graminum]
MVALQSTLFILFALCGEVLAATIPAVCATEMGTASIAANKIPRSTTTVKASVTVVKRVIRKVNVVVVPRSRTTTETETFKTTRTVNADPDVETAIEIVTNEQTERLTSYITTTSTSITSTITTKFTTNTVPAPAGFTPLGLPVIQPAKLKPRAAKRIPNLPQLRTNNLYAQRVVCTKTIPTTTIKTITSTIQGPRKTLQLNTKTKVVKSTETIIETSYPPKITQTDTETVSPTVTEWDTVTREATSIETS